jgi:hypothetical protein
MKKAVVSYVASCCLLDINHVSEELTASIIRAMEALSCSETSASIYQTTRRNITEDAIFIYELFTDYLVQKYGL